MNKNKLKEKLQSGQPSFGVSVMIPSPQVVEMVGGQGFDWVMLDREHGTIGLECLELMMIAAEASGITPIVRPQTNDPVEVMRVMDRGAMGVQVPHVNTAAAARRAVESVKFHPLGQRGLAAGTRPSRYGLGLSGADYTREANRETLVCVQLEEVEALRNIDEILQVEGIDVYFIGPSDLSQSMGYPGQTDAPEVHTAIAQAMATIVAAGKVPGSTGNNAAITDYLSKGCLYLYTHLPRLLSAGAADFMRVVKK